MRVKVYKNLHNGKFSMVAVDGQNKGRVIGYASRLHMTDVIFKVSQAGRKRVLEEKRKNVHAFVIGTLTNALDYDVRLDNIPEPMKLQFIHDCYAAVKYNPYKYDSFVGQANNDYIKVSGAASIYLHPDGMICEWPTFL